MKYKYKLELKENGEWQDFTDFCIQPFSLKDPLDETLSTMTVKMYLDRKATLIPSTMARFSVYQKAEEMEYTLKERYDFVVDTDNVYKEVLQGNKYYAHEIVFVEPLAILQKYTVENIALTYQLEDMVQYLDTGALKANLQLVSTDKIQSKIIHIPDDTVYSQNLYYTYCFDPSPYTASDGKERRGLNEWSKIIYFKEKSGYNQLYRIDKDGNEIACGYYAYPYIPYCPLWCEEYNARTGNVRRFQLAYDVYVEEIDLTTGEVVEPERLLRTIDLYNGDDRQFVNGSSYNISAVTNIGYNDTAGQYANTTYIQTAFQPKDELFVDYINSSYKAYWAPSEFETVIYYWFPVKPNRRYNMRYTRNRNLRFTDGIGLVGADSRHIASGLPANCMYYKTAKGEVIISALGSDNQLQYPELQYSFDVLDISADAGQIDVAVPTPSEYAYKYNCYDYLLKAFYSTGNYKEGDPLPFAMTDEVRQMLQLSPIYECQNAGNTLYDVCMYIGRYKHAIPYCYFGDGDLIFLDFLPLGKGEVTPATGRVTSIYSSRNLAEYLSSFDSYVSNLVNNDSDIEEVLCAKSDDDSSLVYADNAVLLLSRPCYGIKEFYVARRSRPTEWKSLIKNSSINSASFICEKSIYNILDFRAQYTPNRGSCLYYTLGGNKIEGLQYKRPNPISAGEENTAIQNIIGRLWWYDTVASNVNVNDYIFKIKYRTYDNTRVRLFRPDLKRYLCNTTNDYYPMQRSYRSQTEKVINSDFYGRNLVGELVRTGNEVQQRDFILDGYDDLPRAGDLQNIDGVPHYVSEVTIPFYNEYISASVIYSKDFQRLSSIISIPAENRFYEIATQGIVNRVVANDEFVVIDTEPHNQTGELTACGRKCLLDRILSTDATPIRYAVVTFRNKESNRNALNIEIVKPVHSFGLHSSFGCSIEMEDNYSAGTQVLNNAGFQYANANNIVGAFNAIGSDIAMLYAKGLLNTNINVLSGAYKTLLPVRYCDKFGNADLYDIRLYGEQALTIEQVAQQPLYKGGFQNPLFVSVGNELRKDNREKIGFLPQQNAIAFKDSIIIGLGFWKEKTKAVQCYAYTKPLNKNDEYLPAGGTNVNFSYNTENGVVTMSNVPNGAVAVAFGYENTDGDLELIFGINERATSITLSFVKKI